MLLDNAPYPDPTHLHAPDLIHSFPRRNHSLLYLNKSEIRRSSLTTTNHLTSKFVAKQERTVASFKEQRRQQRQNAGRNEEKIW